MTVAEFLAELSAGTSIRASVSKCHDDAELTARWTRLLRNLDFADGEWFMRDEDDKSTALPARYVDAVLIDLGMPQGEIATIKQQFRDRDQDVHPRGRWSHGMPQPTRSLDDKHEQQRDFWR